MTDFIPETDRERYIRYRNDEIRKYEHAVEVVQNLVDRVNNITEQITKLTIESESLRADLAEAYKSEALAEESLTKFVKTRKHYN